MDAFLHVQDFLSPAERARLLAQVNAQRGCLRTMRSRSGLGPRYAVIDGETLAEHLPELLSLRAQRIIPLLEAACGHAIEPLRSPRRAARVQVYSQLGDGFRWHRDGHEFAAVLTLAVEGDGHTEVIATRPSKLLKHALYPLYALPNLMSLAPSTSIRSRPGDLLLLRGRDAIHRGAPATAPGERIVVVYALDRRGRRPRPLQDLVARMLNY